MIMMSRAEIRTKLGWTDDMIRSLLHAPESTLRDSPGRDAGRGLKHFLPYSVKFAQWIRLAEMMFGYD